MLVSLMADPWSGTFDDVADEVAFAQRIGASTYWMAQVWRMEAMTLIPTLAEQAPGLQFATGVVPTYMRHPAALASQALTTNLLTGGRFTLGIGPSSRPIIEGMYGLSFDRPVRHMREYLDILLPLLEQHPVDTNGQLVGFHGAIDVPAAPAPGVMMAALGSQMLRVCGARTAGTITWMTGPKTVGDHVAPVLSEAADRAGRPAPRVVAALAVRVTDEVAEARRAAARALGPYGQVSSYRAMLDREGLAEPQDFAIIGAESEVREALGAYERAGATEVALMVLGRRDRDRTRELIATLV